MGCCSNIINLDADSSSLDDLDCSTEGVTSNAGLASDSLVGDTLKFDQPTLDRLALVYPDVRVRWIRVANDFFNLHKIQLKIAQGLRTFADQQKIYSQGRSLENGVWVVTNPHKIVSHAPPGDSWHHYCAVDSCFAGPDPWLAKHPEGEKLWAEYARIGKAHGFFAGFDWAGSKNDRPHLEMHYGDMSLSQAKALYLKGKLGMVWAAFDKIRGVEVGADWQKTLNFAKLKTIGVIA